MESTLQQIYVWHTVCIVLTVLLGLAFVLCLALAMRFMSAKRIRPNEGFSELFIALSAAAVVLALLPAVGTILTSLQLDATQQHWATEQVQLYEEENHVKLSTEKKDEMKAQLLDELRDNSHEK